MHDDQLTVSRHAVRELVREQFPHWRGLAVRTVASDGTMNAVFRIGSHLVARFPLRYDVPDEILTVLKREAEAARELAACSTVATPLPVALGAPGPGYPLPWAVETWVPGRVAARAAPERSSAFAGDLARFITGLRAADTRGRRFSGQCRGGHLPDHDAWMETCFQRSEQLLDVPALRRLWQEFRRLPRAAPDVMSHGDLVPGNVLVRGGRLVGVVDCGGFGPADPSLDLVCAWHLLERAPRELLRRELGCGELEWARGAAWSFEQAMGLVWYYADSKPTLSQLGRRTLDRVLNAEVSDLPA